MFYYALLRSHFAAEGNSVNEMEQVEMLRFALEYAEIIQVMPSSEVRNLRLVKDFCHSHTAGMGI